MVGREVGDIFPKTEHQFGDVALSVEHLTAYSTDAADKKLVDDVSFEVRKGEVLGIAGLMGSGRTEMLMTIFGAWRGRSLRSIKVEGRDMVITSPRDAIRRGIGFVTEDRKRFGLILDQTILENMTLAGLRSISGRFITDSTREAVAVRAPMESLRVKAPSPLTVTNTLSGGNQQKVVLGKWLLTNPKILFLDEPTRGIDVGAKQEIYAEINKLARQGLAIVLVSSELPEVLGLSDRVIVLHEGKLTGEFIRSEATPEKVMAAATGNLSSI
jgi:ABC-type sugar transport system, ATPase component